MFIHYVISDDVWFGKEAKKGSSERILQCVYRRLVNAFYFLS
ncbi:hypothetical protein HMPREF9418_2774 [Neisseria macacae ATCC 33926]|uniref:Uncharacterized protein n=1 Tax=Neisseria macacae ATCC 33926 TaxID=997348 RepID=A0AA36UGE2_9NEIS|nr:hypothetical protein HMPREF9418_2774 [Neisseria macacae ATCC 33926]